MHVNKLNTFATILILSLVFVKGICSMNGLKIKFLITCVVITGIGITFGVSFALIFMELTKP